MKRSTATVSVGAWLLIVAMALIVNVQSSSGTRNWFSKKPKPVENRTDADWNKLGKACAEKLSEDDPIKVSFSKLKRISKDTDCTEELQEDILYWHRRNLPKKCVSTVHDYFNHYLSECGFEELVSQALDDVEKVPAKDWALFERQSAYSFIGHVPMKGDLLFIESLPEISHFSKEFTCIEEHKTNLTDWLHQTHFKFQVFRPLVRTHIELYLEKCGFEEHFKKVIKSLEQNPKLHWNSAAYPSLSSFPSYFLEDEERLILTLETVEKLSELDSIPITDLCVTDRFSELQVLIERCDTRYTSYPSQPLYALVRKYLAYYLDKCGLEESFKKLIDKKNDYTTEQLAKYETLFDLFEQGITKQSHWRKVVSAIRELSTLESISEANCTMQLKDRLLHWLSVYGDEVWFPRLIRQYFFKYLDKCGVKEHFKRLINGDIEDLIEFPWRFGSSYSRFSKNVEWILSAIEKMTGLESVSNDDTGCSQQLRTNLLEPLDPKTRNYGKLRPLAVKYYTLYSDKCGLEDSFKKRVANMNAGGHWNLAEYPTLNSYLTGKFLGKPTLNSMLLLIEKLSRLDTTSKEIECTNELAQQLLGAIYESKEDYPELHLLLKEYLALYKGECGWLNLEGIV